MIPRGLCTACGTDLVAGVSGGVASFSSRDLASNFDGLHVRVSSPSVVGVPDIAERPEQRAVVDLGRLAFVSGTDENQAIDAYNFQSLYRFDGDPPGWFSTDTGI